MEAPKLQDAVIEIDGEGTLHGDDVILSHLKRMQFQVRFQGSKSTWEPIMSEIADPEERMHAQREWVRQLTKAVASSRSNF